MISEHIKEKMRKSKLAKADSCSISVIAFCDKSVWISGQELSNG